VSGAVLGAAAALLVSSCDFLLVSDPCTLQVTIRTSHARVALQVGESQTVSATPSTPCGERPRREAEVDLEWSSSDPGVARVDPRSGEIQAVSQGEALVLGEDRGPLQLPPVEVAVQVGG
jgi:hypothetical protein